MDKNVVQNISIHNSKCLRREFLIRNFYPSVCNVKNLIYICTVKFKHIKQ